MAMAVYLCLTSRGKHLEYTSLISWETLTQTNSLLTASASGTTPFTVRLLDDRTCSLNCTWCKDKSKLLLHYLKIMFSYCPQDDGEPINILVVTIRVLIACALLLYCIVFVVSRQNLHIYCKWTWERFSENSGEVSFRREEANVVSPSNVPGPNVFSVSVAKPSQRY